MQRKLAYLLSLIAVVAIVVAGCAAPAASPATPAADSVAPSDQPLRIVHFVNGVLGDKSFFDSAQRGIQRAADELGAQ
ncbi:MAG: hypothetical protein R6W76_07800, partial [Caldilinea sp.]